MLVLVLCVGLPLFVGFLRPWWVRALLLVLIAGIWGLVAFLRWRKARKARRGDRGRARCAVGRRRGRQRGLGADGRSARAAALERGQEARLLYARPWYVIIGPPGAGKTTALLNSGLRFPFADQR